MRSAWDVLLKMVQERGGKLSRAAEKLFSSNEGTPEKSGSKAPQVQPSRGQGPADLQPSRGRGPADDARSSRPDKATELEALKRRIEELESSREMRVQKLAVASMRPPSQRRLHRPR